MKRFSLQVFVLMLVIGFLYVPESQAQWFFKNKKVKGNGNVVTEERDIQKDFEGIQVKGSFDVEVTQNQGNFVKVEADENLQEHITTEVKKGILVISTEKNLYRAKKLNVYVGMDVINALKVSGSGDITAKTPITSDDLKIAVSGSGDIDVSEATADQISISIAGSGDVSIGGQTNTSNVSIAGSGDVEAGKLESANCTISIAGSGGADVYASESLTAKIAGSGDVRYGGSPQISTSVAGSGNISKK